MSGDKLLRAVCRMVLHAYLRLILHGPRLVLRACLAAVALCVAASVSVSAQAQTRETVVLLHGMGRTRASMAVLAERFRGAGYETLSFPYGTTKATLDETSDSFASYIDKNVKTERYHLVAHSLGNIIIRNAMRRKLRPGLGRIVMLAPPNKPARLAKLLKENPVFRWRTGDSGQKLGEDEFYKTLPTPSVEFGIIAADKGQKLTFEEPNDGIVDVASTKLEGMKAFKIVHHTHTFMMNAKDTFSLCRRFLESGSFEGPEEETNDALFDSAVAFLRGQSAGSPEEAVVRVMKYMRENILHNADLPPARGPHEWSGRRALSSRSVNGCVESAKVFFELIRAAFPKFKAVYLDSFNAVSPGGHAVVEVADSKGQGVIVDAASFWKLPGRGALIDEAALSSPVEFRKEFVGKVIQFVGHSDVFIAKKDGKYLLAVYPYMQVFARKPESERTFDALDDLNRALAEHADSVPVDFRYLQEYGLILPYVDDQKSGFLYSNPLGGTQAKHVIYGCYSQLPARDDAEIIEPSARENYKRTGKAGTCDWSKVK